MKKRILGILTVVLALSMVFSMISCGGDDKKPAKVTITFEPPSTITDAGFTTYTKDVDKGKPVAASVLAAPAGLAAKYTFVEWEYKADNTPVVTGAIFEVATTLVAKLVAAGTASYTVTFEDAAGATLKTVSVFSGQTVAQANFPANPTKTGELFSGWFVKGTQTAFTSATVVIADITVEPKFVPAGTTYTVTFENPAGTTVKTVTGIVPLATVAQTEFPANPTPPEGYTFVEWRIKDTTTRFTATTQITGDLSVVAFFRAEGNINYVTISFNVNYPAGLTYNGPAIAPLEVEEEMEIGDLPTVAAPDGYVFGGWFTPQGVRVTAESTFLANTTLSARWVPTTLTGDDADELLYLQNGASAIYKFEIPAGNSLADYKSLSVDYKISAAGLAVWDADGVGLFHLRLLGVYTDSTPVATAADNDPPLKYLDRNTLSTPYIIDNNKTPSSVRPNVTANDWFNIEYDLSGASKHADALAANMPSASHTGTVYFALGLSCQTTNGGEERNKAFIQLVKDIKLVPTDDAEEVPGVKPGDDYGQFVAYNDPIVLEWRGEPTQANIDNPPLPEFVVAPFSRGDPPADEDLVKVLLGEGDNVFSYINGGQLTNQRGWVSFSEAGRANAQQSTVVSPVTFNNFINAWYLVVEVKEKPTGTLALVWMGDANGWRQNNATTNTGEPLDGVSWITPVGDDPEAPDSYILKFLLPEALLAYQSYFEDNEEWAGLGFSYWGANNHNVVNLGATKAYLLVAEDEAEGNATGVAVGLTFTLGTAPEGGDIIVDIALVDDQLVVSANLALGLTDYRWYVNGVLTNAGNVLTTEAESTVITLQAKRGGKWVSQAVNITVKSE